VSRQCIGIAGAVALLALAVGCGSGGGRVKGTVSVPDDRPTAAKVELLRAPKQPGEVIVHGDASPADHGPYTLHGRYVARFQQYAPEDPRLDFGGETPFVARLVRPSGDGPRAQRRLFRAATASGRTTVTATGSWRIEVAFGDFPYVIRLTPSS
jgi:hypothetical protein